MKPKIIKITSYPQYLRRVAKLGYKGWLFRGHSACSWHIESSLSRFYRTHQLNIRATSLDARELDSIRKFQKAAHQYLNHLPEEHDLPSWLAVMQHFGAPTRLIDFTFSPLAALFFAAVDSVGPVGFGQNPTPLQLNLNYKPFCVHAVHLDSVRFLTIERLKQIGIQIKQNPEAQHYCIGNSASQQAEFVGFFEGRWQNPRQIAQQGLFMIPSKIDVDIHQFLRAVPGKPAPYSKPWIIFEFKGGRVFYRNIIKGLLSANATAASLFPGMEGLAKSMSLRFYEVVKQLP